VTDSLQAPPVAEQAAPSPVMAADRGRSGDTGRYIRGSGLLLGGRGISLLLNLAVQVLIVRYLSKSDYGAFAYALGIASIGSSFLLLGLDKATSRFVPIYQERGEEGKAFGTIALAAGIIWGLGLTVVLLVFGMRGLLEGTAVNDPLSLSLVLVLIALAPVQAFDSLLQNVMAVFVGAKAIFFRRHVIGPALKLAAVLLVIGLSGDVFLLAYGYLVGALIGIALYLWILIRTWHRRGLLSHLRPGRLELPTREVLGYSLPLLSSVLISLLAGSFAVVILEYYHGTRDVAEFRAVLPIARLNIVALQSFSMLFIPLASRMFARNDRDGLNDLYWRTATWIAVLTFPVFAVTFSLAEPLTVLLFGAEYAGSAALLAVLALGSYFNAALGFNAYTLKVYGKVRYIVVIDVVTGVLGLMACVLLISRFGAMGAALGATFTLVLHNLLNHAALLVVDTGVRILDGAFLKMYLVIAVISGALLLVQQLLSPPFFVGLALVAVSGIILLRTSRHALKAEETFPKLLRIPLLRYLVAER
jgi:O-antigen/teichoic acid export membrane protein